jgi:hypothetical protein
VTDRAGKSFKVNGRDPRVSGIRRSKPALVRPSFPGQVITQMAALTGEIGFLLFLIFLGFSLISSNHVVADIIPVAVHTFQAGSRVDILLCSVSFLSHLINRMTGKTALVIDFRCDVKKDPVFAVEPLPYIPHEWNHSPLSVIRIGSVIKIPGPRKP